MSYCISLGIVCPVLLQEATSATLGPDVQAEAETQTSVERDEARGGWGMLEPLLGEPSIIRNLLRACPHSYMLRRDAISLIAGAMMGQENAWVDETFCIICGQSWGGEAVRPCAFACEHAHVACVCCVANCVTKMCTTKRGGVVGEDPFAPAAAVWSKVWSKEQEDAWMAHDGVESRSCELQRVMPCCVCAGVCEVPAGVFSRVHALGVHNGHPVDIGLPQLVLSKLPSHRRWKLSKLPSWAF